MKNVSLVKSFSRLGLSVAAMAVMSAPITALASTCPANIRFVHGHAFNDSKVDVLVNGKRISQMDFRTVTSYERFKAGKMTVAFQDTQSGQILGEKEFRAAAGHSYTIVVAGPAKGPADSLFGNSSPFVFMDDLTPPNPGRWKGHWYRLSETDVVIDLRVSDGNDPSKEVTRLIQKPNRAAYQLADMPQGVFQFNPVMPGSSEPFFNTALTPPAFVQVAGLSVQGGDVVDIFALGNFLGRAPNSLQLTAVKVRPELDKNGCVVAK